MNVSLKAEALYNYQQKARPRSVDPTHTTGIRNSFAAQMRKRFMELSAAIRKAIVDEDCFGLQPDLVLFAAGIPTPGPKAFNFPLNQQKIDGFMAWMKEQEKGGILQLVTDTQLGEGARVPWTNTYVRSSYQKGIYDVRSKLKIAGYPVTDMVTEGGIEAVFNQPFHVDRIGMAYSRVYNELEGITGAMDQQISRTLADGLTAGLHPQEIAKNIHANVKGIELTRARTLARTEVVRAHHSAHMAEYKNWGVAGINVEAELITAGFNVCPICENLQNTVYTLKQAETLLPIHPNCRCTTIPTRYGKKEEQIPAEVYQRDPAMPAKMDEARETFGSGERFWELGRTSGHEKRFKYGGDFKSEEDFFIKVFGSRKAARKLAKDVMEDSSVYMAVKASTFRNQIVKSGRFKNSMETGKGTFKTIGEARAKKERDIFGITAKTEEFDLWPKYGFISSAEKMTHEDIVGWGYGDVFVKFKKAKVRKRTTVTLGDSYDGNRYRKSPKTGKIDAERVTPVSEYGNADERFFLKSRFTNEELDDWYITRLQKAKNIDDVAEVSGNYVEAQIYGKLDLSDVESLFVSSKKEAEAIRKALDKAGWKDIKIIASEFDERMKLLGEHHYSGKGSYLAHSLNADDLDLLGDAWIKDISKRWIGTAVSWRNSSIKPFLRRPAVDPSFKWHSAMAPGVDAYEKGTMTVGEMRAWLKEFFKNMAMKENSVWNLPKVWWEDYRKTYSGFVSDVFNEELLIGPK